MIKTFLICHFCIFPLYLNSINTDHKHCSCPCNLKNIGSSKLKRSHRKGHFQACIWLILRHFKLKLSVKMQKKILPFSPIDVIHPKPPALSYTSGVMVGQGTSTKMLLPKKILSKTLLVYIPFKQNFSCSQQYLLIFEKQYRC